MLAGDWLRAAEKLPETADPRAVLGDGPALVLAPHPDDESLGCGGLIAAAAAAGLPLRVVVVSDGTGSHPAVPPARLKALREAETRAAIAALGLPPKALGFLGLADQGVPAEGAGRDAAVAAILAGSQRLMSKRWPRGGAASRGAGGSGKPAIGQAWAQPQTG